MQLGPTLVHGGPTVDQSWWLEIPENGDLGWDGGVGIVAPRDPLLAS